MAARPNVASPAWTVVDADGARTLLDSAELWRHRDLLLFLAWRDIRVRYRQTLLGAAWAIIEPAVGVLIFTLLFNRLAGIRSGTIPYPLSCGAAMLLWTFFARALRAITLSLVANASLVSKAYFPRLILPLSTLLATLLDLVCALAVFSALLVYYGVPAGWPLLTLPIWALLAALHALGIGLALAAINVRYRDISQAVPFLIQVWMFATPVAYPLSAMPARWLTLYSLNPLVGPVEGMRWALLPGYHFDPLLLLPSLAVGAISLFVGLVCFRRTERRFADIV
jgi:lipopolysaccharide transport system permease protein